MRVYIPFSDGSSLAYDGEKFTLHRCPVEIDADLSARSDGEAALAWRERRGALVDALKSAWFKEKERKKQSGMKTIYTRCRASL